MDKKLFDLIYHPAKDVLPLHKLIDLWAFFYTKNGHTPEIVIRHVASRAAEWGADIELEMCARFLDSSTVEKTTEQLIFNRRPKPPSLKEEALEALEKCSEHIPSNRQEIIRRALEE